MNGGKKTVKHTMIIFAMPRSKLQNDAKYRAGQNLIGILASSKIGGAVQRNFAKRRYRAAIRQNLSIFDVNFVYIIVARKSAITCDFTNIERDMSGIVVA